MEPPGKHRDPLDAGYNHVTTFSCAVLRIVGAPYCYRRLHRAEGVVMLRCRESNTVSYQWGYKASSLQAIIAFPDTKIEEHYLSYT